MTTSELIAEVAERSELTKKTTTLVLKSLIGAIHKALKDGSEMRIDALGTFKVTERKERTGVNPRTQAKITVPATNAPTFRAAKALKEVVKEQDKKSEKKKK